MSELLRVLRAEVVKLAYTRTIWATVALAAGAAAVITASEVVVSSAAALRTLHHLRVVLGLGGGFSVLGGGAAGVLATAGEHRYGTHATLLVVAPRRRRVVLCRVLASAVAGLAVGLACALCTVAVAAVGAAAHGASFSPFAAVPAKIFGGTLLCGAAAGALGAGVGSLIARQGPALAVGLAWILLVDELVARLVPGLGRFLPGGARSALLDQPLRELPAAGVAVVVLVIWAALLGAAGARAEEHRDLRVGA